MPSLPRFGRPEFRCRNTACALSRRSSPNACRLHRSPPRQFPPDARSKIERRPCPTVLPIGPHCPIALRPYLAHAAARSPLDRPASCHGLPPSVTRLARLTTVTSRAAPSRPRQVSASLENLTHKRYFTDCTTPRCYFALARAFRQPQLAAANRLAHLGAARPSGNIHQIVQRHHYKLQRDENSKQEWHRDSAKRYHTVPCLHGTVRIAKLKVHSSIHSLRGVRLCS